jgi:transposase
MFIFFFMACLPNPNKGGGVKGHQGPFRELLPVDEVDEVVSCKLAKRCVCGERKLTNQDVLRHQVYEFSRKESD